MELLLTPRHLTAGIAVLVAALLVLPASLAANAATMAGYSDEVGGTGAAARASTSLLNAAWQASVAANGGTAQAPAILPSGTITSLPPAADGTMTTVTRTRYTTALSPAYVAPSPNQGTGTCVANGAGAGNAGAGQQGNAPRPTALVGGGAACPNGFAYGEFGGAGESTTRDAVEFAFDRPVLAFGAWFGDLETRTDGFGVAAVVRLYGVGGVLVSDQVVVPGPAYLPQSNCGGTYTGCGNTTTRWVGFVADPAVPIIRMVVIVGDDDAAGDATDEGIGFIGPTFDLSTASLTLVKSALPLADTNADGLSGAGDTISYSFLVTNEGTLAVSSVTIADASAFGLSCPPGSLAPGASMTCIGSHVVTQPEVNTGSVTNTATATGTVYGGTIASNPSTHVTTIPGTSSLTISKIVDLPTFSAVDTVLSYDVTVTNAGNLTATAVTVSDSPPGAGAFSTDCGALNATLQPLATITCVASYTVTQADLDAGSVANSASSSGTSPGGTTIGPVSATATSSAVQSVSLDLIKTVTEPTFDAVGDLLHYTITVSNGGNVTLDQLTVVDPPPGAGNFTSTCAGVAPLLPAGASTSCTATYAVTQADLDAGVISNFADASARAPGGVATNAPQASATSTAIIDSDLGITKTVAEPTYAAVGDVLNYTITVTNNGTVTITSLVVVDANPGSGVFNTDCAAVAASLAPAASAQCAADYTVTQADLDAGAVINSASADGIAAGAAVDSPIAQATSTAAAVQSLTLSKTPDVASFSAVDDVIGYTLLLENNGNVTLSSPHIIDSNPGAGAFTSDCGAVVGPIAPGGSVSCTAYYTVTQADIDAGSLSNTADAQAIAPSTSVVVAPSAVVVTPANQAITLLLAKTVAEPSFDTVDDELHYTLSLTNMGNTTLTSATIADDAPGSGSYSTNCAAVNATLAPGASVSCSATYRITQTDVDAGTVTNHARGTADDPSANPHLSNNASATSTAIQTATFALAKTSAVTVYHGVGDVVNFTITLVNTGNVSLTSTTVSDSSPGAGAFTTDCGLVAGILSPGASRDCHATYTIVASDLSASGRTNVASATATAAGGAVIGPVLAQVSVARGAPALATTGNGIATIALTALALIVIGGWTVRLRRTRVTASQP